jgi:hypothetical protein
MKSLLKWAFRLLILMIVLGVAAVLLMDTIFKSLAERRIKDYTGLDVKIGKFEISFLNRKMVIEKLVLYNNAEFGGSPMLDLPELYLECDPAAFSDRKIRLKMARFNLGEINVVDIGTGTNNFVALMDRMEKHQKTSEAAGKKTLDSSLEFDGIDTFNLTLGKLRLTNLKQPGESKEFDIGIKNEVFRGIRNQDDLASKLMPLLMRRGVSIASEMISGQPMVNPPVAPTTAPVLPPPAPPARVGQ